MVGGSDARDDCLGVADVRDDDATAVDASVEVDGGGGGARQRVVDLLRRPEHLVSPLVRVDHGGVDDGAASGQPASGAGSGNELRGQVLPRKLRALVARLPVSVVDAEPVRALLAADVGDRDEGVLVGLVERARVVAALRDGGPADLCAARQGDRRLRHLGKPLCDLALREVADLQGAERPVVGVLLLSLGVEGVQGPRHGDRAVHRDRAEVDVERGLGLHVGVNERGGQRENLRLEHAAVEVVGVFLEQL
mmetsp:Transcript_20466/g.48522  ORF Transcript_20466/g.48522 Transcript_20466/m.48522 type:complete len:251 (+) Transcript_20466:1670-2422(+)